MKYIFKEPNIYGAYGAIQVVDREDLPERCYLWPDALDDTEFIQKQGFVTLKIKDDTVNSYEINEVAYEAYVAERQEIELKVAYERRTVELIRQRYDNNDEYKILREYIAQQKTEQFDEYNNYVEQCKQQAHEEIYGGEES